MAKKTRPNRLEDQLLVQQSHRAQQNIQRWRTAIQIAESVDNPRRIQLYDLYDEISLDLHLESQIQTRQLAVMGASYSIVNSKDGKEDVELTKLFKKPWFIETMKHAHNSILWGHSLIEFSEFSQEGELDNEVKEVTLIKRKHVIPEKGLFVKQQGDSEGILYRENKLYTPWLFEVGTKDNLGLLNKVVPHVLFKRFAQSSWSEFCEIFGMPARIGKTKSKDKRAVSDMEKMLINMGTAAYAVIDSDESVELMNGVQGDGTVYDKLIERCNSEISKGINGAVVGEGSSSGGGSRAKEEVGNKKTNIFADADKILLQGYFNEKLFPLLIKHGYPLKGYEIKFEQTKDTKALWDIVKGMLQYKEVDNEWIEQQFGIPVTDKKVAAPTKLSHESGFFD